MCLCVPIHADMQMCLCMWVYRPEVNISCPQLLHQQTFFVWLNTSWLIQPYRSSCLCLLHAQIINSRCHISLGNWTQVLTLVPQGLYQLYGFPSPRQNLLSLSPPPVSSFGKVLHVTLTIFLNRGLLSSNPGCNMGVFPSRHKKHWIGNLQEVCLLLWESLVWALQLDHHFYPRSTDCLSGCLLAT